jgi:hypothetical protein
METKIYDNKSLKFLCNQINLGLIDEEYDLEKLIIKSKLKPNYIIKIIDIDIVDFIKEHIPKIDLFSKVDQFETNTYDYIVFGISEDTNQLDEKINTLRCISLFELISVELENINKNEWNLDSEEWDLIYLEN